MLLVAYVLRPEEARADYGVNAACVNSYFYEKGCVSNSTTPARLLKELGNNVRRERMAGNLTQEGLAELADLNIRNVQRIEAGEVDVLLSTACRLRKALGCSWEKLLPKGWR